MLDVFLTHKHADHCGLAHELELRGARIFMNAAEDRHGYDCLYYRLDGSHRQSQQRVLTRTGITEELAPLIWHRYQEFNSRLNQDAPIWMMTIDAFAYTDIRPGAMLRYGDYCLEAVPLRGHTFGQLGLQDAEKKLLFSADQILNRTTPIVGTSYHDEHLLLCYLDSIRRLARVYADYLILPAHEGPVEDIIGAVGRIFAAYQRKIDQTFSIIRWEEEKTVWQVTREVYHLTPDKTTDADFYNTKMTNSKTFSMLEYLYDSGAIRRREENGILYYSR